MGLCFSLSSEYHLSYKTWNLNFTQISQAGQHNFYQDSDTKVVSIYTWLIQKITTNLSKMFKTEIKFKWRNKICITISLRNIYMSTYTLSTLSFYAYVWFTYYIFFCLLIIKFYNIIFFCAKINTLDMSMFVCLSVCLTVYVCHFICLSDFKILFSLKNNLFSIEFFTYERRSSLVLKFK